MTRPALMISVNMLRLLTFGGLALERRDGPPPPRLRPQRLAILAVLAAAGERGVSRERMSGLFWPDADEERSRHSLRQALYALRQELGAEAIRSEPILSIDPGVLASDIGEFRAAIAEGDAARAAELATGPFLQGFYLPGAPDFERWVEEERASVAAEATRVTLALTKRAEANGDMDAATEWWRRLTLMDPLSGRFALGYLKALAARGDRAGALAFARAHESVVRRELEADPDPEILKLESELRAMPSPPVVRVAPVREAPAAAAARQEPPVGESAPPQAMIDGSGISGAPTSRPAPPPRRSRRLVRTGAFISLLVLAGALAARQLGWAFRPGPGSPTPTFAVGMIREDGVPDTLRIGGVLTDMLATNLARVAGLSVLANSRLFELMLPGQDTLVAGYSTAARRAGATEILQGRLLAGPGWSLALEMQRVDLATGLVKGAYRVAAGDRYALIDSLTATIARDLRLGSPRSSVADATTDSPIAYRLYEEGLRAYYQYDADGARRLMEAALEEDSTFAMAAYYLALLTSGGDAGGTRVRERAIRLAMRAPEQQRLTITADLSEQLHDPNAYAVAETLSVRYPDDPRASELLARAFWSRGDWPAAVGAIERAIALDSAAEPVAQQKCRLCGDLGLLAETYLWWDSLPAAERTAQRFRRLRPSHHAPMHILVRVAAARGDTGATKAHFRRLYELNPVYTVPEYLPRYLALAEEYDEVIQGLQPLLQSPRENETLEGRWILAIVLRNQGRLDEALRVTRLNPSPNFLAEALVLLEKGDARAAASILRSRDHVDESLWSPGLRARHHSWNKTLLGMALVAAGDTTAVRRLVDSVAYWGQRSNYGRDQRLHHYLRGMLFVAQNRDAEAVEELRQAIYSPAHGFTRVNYELGQALMRLDRPAEAVPVVRAALHGDIDGSNLYMTRTDLHELLAQAFARVGNRDSAAVHYRAVLKAWERADPLYHGRRDRARAWLAQTGGAVR